MAVAHTFGVALSGGGFRAAAFHLGVLKRLRELGLLQEADLLSTVSGGSIVGAAWVTWQATVGDTLRLPQGPGPVRDPDEWDRFEHSLVSVMRGGLRGRVLWLGFGLPFVLATIIASAWAWFTWPLSPWGLAGLAVGVFVVAYVIWHYTASTLLRWFYCKKLFGETTVGAVLAPPPGHPRNGRDWPRLIINATALNVGEQLLFTPRGRLMGWVHTLREAFSFFKTVRRLRPSIEMPEDISLATAVAASSAFPGAFTPLPIEGPLARIGQFLRRALSVFQPWKAGPAAATYWAVDGGVFDNQGTQALLEERCRSVIVSDAAKALVPEPAPSTWQFLPPGRGVVNRTHDIIYERARDLGYRRLADRRDLSRLIERAVEEGLSIEAARKLAGEFQPVVEGYAYVELRPSERFRWRPNIPRLSEVLVPLVAGIRTDLDRFSSVEISALMFHGYTLIDHCLSAYHPDWILNQAASAFRSSAPGITIDWANLSREDLVRYARHLDASNSRIFIWRGIRRLRNRLVPEAVWTTIPGKAAAA